jgi:YggT family protein
MADSWTGAGIFMVQTFVGLYVLFLVIRFLMQASRADYYNPICQSIVRLTDPAIKPFRFIFPTLSVLDTATLATAVVIQTFGIAMIMAITGNSLFNLIYFAWAFVGILSNILNVYFFSLLILVIASWLAPYSGHPIIQLVQQITDPLCKPARRLIPPLGGLDFSLILVFVAVNLLDNFLLVRPMALFFGVPNGLITGLY